MRRIIFDTETTGVSIREKHRIIEVGCIETIDFKKTGKVFHCFFNPEREIDAGATRIHGKTLHMLLDKPKFREKADEFLNFIKNSELIAHNSPFDISFINYELLLIGMPPLTNEVTDSLIVARRRFPGQAASLDALCKRLKVDNSSREFHGALLDADLLCDVFIRMCEGDSLTEKFEYKPRKEDISQIKRNISFKNRTFKVSDEDMEKYHNLRQSMGF